MPYLYSKIATERDIDRSRRAMIEDGHFGAGMSDCFVVGINGNCGEGCPVWQDGECESFDYDTNEWD